MIEESLLVEGVLIYCQRRKRSKTEAGRSLAFGRDTPVLCTDLCPGSREIGLEEKGPEAAPSLAPVYACCKSRTRIIISIVWMRKLRLRQVKVTQISQLGCAEPCLLIPKPEPLHYVRALFTRSQFSGSLRKKILLAYQENTD